MTFTPSLYSLTRDFFHYISLFFSSTSAFEYIGVLSVRCSLPSPDLFLNNFASFFTSPVPYFLFTIVGWIYLTDFSFTCSVVLYFAGGRPTIDLSWEAFEAFNLWLWLSILHYSALCFPFLGDLWSSWLLKSFFGEFTSYLCLEEKVGA